MRLIVAVVVCVLAPMVYTLLSLASVVPMTVPIFLGWLAWLQLVHVVAGVALWRRRATLSTRAKAALLSWGGLVFWYWLPAPVYFVLTMNLDELQVAWTASRSSGRCRSWAARSCSPRSGSTPLAPIAVPPAGTAR